MKKLVLLFLIGALTFTACKKEEITNTNNSSSNGFNSIENYLSSNKPLAQVFTFDSEDGGEFTTDKGSKISIPPNAFFSNEGNAVTGSIDVEFNEIFSKSDMIFSGVLPVSNGWSPGMVLNSGGEFSIEAIQNGDNLRVAENMFVEVEIPAQAVPDENNFMELFIAGPLDNDTVVDWGMPVNGIWNDDDNWNDTSGFSSFTFNSADGTYTISLDTLGWANIDAFNWQINYFDCTFILVIDSILGISASLDNSNTTAFAVFQGQNAVWPVGVPGWGSIQNDTIIETHLADVPLNLLVISVISGDLYYGVLDITPQAGVEYIVPMTLTSAADLDQIIEDLP